MDQESNNLPLVSVLMTAYNREQYIAEAIDSVLASTYTNFELIIVDDGSTDDTVNIAKSFQANDHRVCLYVNERNLGQFQNRNKALSYAKGEYIKYLDSDDTLDSNGLFLIIDAMEKYPDAIAGAEQQGNFGNLPIQYNPRQLFVNHYFKGNNLLYQGPSATVFRKKAFKEFGGFDETIGILSDTLFMLRIAAKYPVVGYTPGTFTWRRHDQQVTVGQENALEMTLQRKRINELVLQDANFPLTTKEKAKLERNLKNIALRKLPRYWVAGKFKFVKSILDNYDFSCVDLVAAVFPNYKVRE